jgi:hypothetical protein
MAVRVSGSSLRVEAEEIARKALQVADEVS